MLWDRGWKVERFETDALVIKRRRADARPIAYAEILTAEHRPTPWGLRLHVRGSLEPLDVTCTGRRRLAIEERLRSAGVRVVDEYGAMITSTVAELEEHLAREPGYLRQSSDNA